MSDAALWDRIEPHTRSENLEEGLQARVADPLWMLARQWQMGELRGEDAASLIHARLHVVSSPLASFRNASEEAATPEAEPLTGDQPLEARVEASTVVSGASSLRLAADAGAQFLRRVDAAGLGELRAALRAAYPLQVSAQDLAGLPEREARRLALLARRGLDGRALALGGTSSLEGIAASAPEIATLTQLFTLWSGEVGDRFVEPGRSGDTWAEERLEHTFSIAAATPSDEVILSADEYPGGHLDWYAFDVADGAIAPHGIGSRPIAPRQLDLLPVPMAYSGMPASRWWELEEGEVYFGGIEAGPADLGRLLLAEFATVYSDDWFLLPVRLDGGTLTRIEQIEVLDTFGETHVVESAAVLDQSAVGAAASRPWAFFELAGDPSPAAGQTPYLLLPSSLAGSLHGEAVEDVSFVRDEVANLAWAIEQSIETPTGKPLRRRQEWGQALQKAKEQAEAAGTAPEANPVWRWRLQTQVPPYWVPLIPERVAPDSADVRLRRGRLLAWEELDPAVAGPRSRILAPERPLRLYEEEIPRTGVQVTRSWQAARGADGQLYLWMARQKRPGRGERGSGLRFDEIER